MGLALQRVVSCRCLCRGPVLSINVCLTLDALLGGGVLCLIQLGPQRMRCLALGS
jgi:hypothetical protein